MDKTVIRDAATVIVVRDKDTAPRILMGQRSATAAFMPSKFVFPGGAVDAEDHKVQLASHLPELCQTRLLEDLRAETALSITSALAATAVRELWEETGLLLGHAGQWSHPPSDDWAAFAENAMLPAGNAMEFIFRALTPPGRSRRFDARFFMVDAGAIHGDLDDFSNASDELSHLQWIPLSDARDFDLPFITEVVLAEIEGRLSGHIRQDGVPFFKNTTDDELFKLLYGGQSDC